MLVPVLRREPYQMQGYLVAESYSISRHLSSWLYAKYHRVSIFCFDLYCYYSIYSLCIFHLFMKEIDSLYFYSIPKYLEVFLIGVLFQSMLFSLDYFEWRYYTILAWRRSRQYFDYWCLTDLTAPAHVLLCGCILF
jgi:hypothetical protein